MFRFKAGQLAKTLGRRALSTSEAAGVKVSSVDDGRAVSELSLVVKAGSRYESTPGVAHLLEKFAFKDTTAKSGLRLVRESELLGGSLSTQLTPEYLVLSAKFLREDLPYFVSALSNTAANTIFRQYELDEQVIPLAQAEATKARSSPVYTALEAAHETAFRKGLAHPTLISVNSPVSLAAIQKYSGEAYTKANVSVFGRGVSHDDLDRFVADSFKTLAEGSALSSAKTESFSGESRIKSAAAEQVAVLSFPTTTRPCLEVLKNVLTNKSVKWSAGNGLLDTIAAKHPGTNVEVVNTTYSDASLFSIVVTGSDAAGVSAVIKEAGAALKKVASSGAPKDAVTRASARAKLIALDAAPAPALAPSVDLSSVSDATVKAKAENLVSGKAVLSVVGKTYELPHLDEVL